METVSWNKADAVNSNFQTIPRLNVCVEWLVHVAKHDLNCPWNKPLAILVVWPRRNSPRPCISYSRKKRWMVRSFAYRSLFCFLLYYGSHSSKPTISWKTIESTGQFLEETVMTVILTAALFNKEKHRKAHSKTLTVFLVENSITNMKSSQMTLVKMDRNDNTDMIFNQPAQKVPIGKKHPTYLHPVLPTKVRNVNFQMLFLSFFRKSTKSILQRINYLARKL